MGEQEKRKGKRHPTIQDNVFIATGAKVLGSITIGENSKIGAGSVVLKEVPPNSTVVGIPGRVVIQDGIKIKKDLNHSDLPDPIADRLKELENEIKQLKEELETGRKKGVSKMSIKIYNSMTRQKEDFVPIEEGKVKMYVCGPTVYNYIHIGNARPAIVFDTVRSYLEYRGYDVQVRFEFYGCGR